MGSYRNIFIAALGVVAPCLALWSPTVPAADTACGAGQTVQGDMGGGAPGTIAEVGSAPPHVGWYRIVFSWNAPGGDWYNPEQWNMSPAGSSARCRAAPPATAASANETRSAPAPDNQRTTAAPTSTDRCPSGTRAVDRKRRQGRIDGENNGMCRFVLDDGSVESLLPWMLSAVGANPQDGGGLAPGSYTCTTNGAGIFRVTLEADGDYVDRAGKSGQYRLNADGTLNFASGSLQGYYGRTLPGGRFGLGARPDSMLATVCDRKG
jgi:hypothetical protein